MQTVSASRIWGLAWERFKETWGPLVGLFVVSILVSFIPFVGSLFSLLIFSPALFVAGLWVAREGKLSFGDPFKDVGKLVLMGLYLVVLFLVPGIIWAIAYTSYGMSVFMAPDTFNPYGEGGSSLGAGFFALILLASLCLFVIQLLFWPGILLLYEGKASFGGAFGAGLNLTLKNIGIAVGFFLLFLLVNLLGAIACGVGLLITVPVSYVAYGIFYLVMMGEWSENNSTLA
ncbi:MAG: hypothetical protein N2170_03830 [Bacteroidia bacterium]|nr:hypothetical protein [Bacteroidia bacterium]